MDKKLIWETAALVLLLLAFPVISVGTDNASKLTWVIGLLAAIVGGVLPVWTRFMDHSADQITDMGPEYDDRTS